MFLNPQDDKQWYVVSFSILITLGLTIHNTILGIICLNSYLM
jgi:hypothetical protein